MSRAISVPVTPSVLLWAVTESGYSVAELAQEIGVSRATLDAWINGTKLPTLSQARPLAVALRRPLASLLLPAPPKSQAPNVEFRRPPRSNRKSLTVIERLHLREAVRIQAILSWTSQELRSPAPAIEQRGLSESAAEVAVGSRKALGVEVESQIDAGSASQAFRLWRGAVEGLGAHVLLSPIGTDGCRGFSLWDDRAPLIVVNSAWNVEARIFTLLHELGHLVTRTNSVCLETSGGIAQQNDATERWCESFAAGVLIPEPALREQLRQIAPRDEAIDLAVAGRLARRFRISVRAATIRLIEHGLATWRLYRSIPAASDHKRDGGGGGARTREDIRRDHFGERTFAVFGEAVRRDVLTYGDVVDYLDTSESVERGARLDIPDSLSE